MPTSLRRAAAVSVSLALLVPLASTEAVAGGGNSRGAAPQASRPWEEGSTQSQRDRAHEIFSDGNDHFFKRDYAQAIELYGQALAVFDHPRIRLALARALIRVGRPADAHPHLVGALRWGAAPLDADEYAEALDLQAALAKQLGVLVIRCRTVGARLTLDAKDIAPCPGEQRHVVMPGRHQVVGSMPGYLTFTGEAVADAGKETALDVELRTLEQAAIKQRRWATWKPWAIVGTGVALALVGAPFRWLATNNMSRFQGRVAALCGTAGCVPGTPEYAEFQNLEPIESRAKLQNGVAISLWALGGAVATTGVVAVVLNREQVVIPKAEHLALAPLVSPSAAGVFMIGEF